jgi:cobalt-zinc-cadmium efflux system outer membrane protein
MKTTLGWLIGVLTIGSALASAAFSQTFSATQSQPGQAQTESSVPSANPQSARSLLLSEALALADRQNLDLAAARLRHAVAAAGIIIAGARPNPTVSFSATRDTPHESLFADLPLEVWGQRGKRIAQAKQELALTDIEISTTQRRVRHDVRATYFAAALAHSMTQQQADATALTHRIKDIAQQRFDAGDIPQLEVMQADLEVARADADLEVARQEEKVASSKLSALLNESAATVWDFGASLEAMPPGATSADLVQRAMAANTDLQHIAQEENVERANSDLLRAERLPDVSVEAGADFNSPPDFKTGARGQLTVGLPIFNRNQGELAASAANLRALEGEATATRRSVTGEVEAAFYQFQARQTEVSLYRDKLAPAARQLESLAEESYKAGRSNILVVIEAQREVQQTQREYLQSLLELQQAFADLEQVVGVSLD